MTFYQKIDRIEDQPLLVPFYQLKKSSVGQVYGPGFFVAESYKVVRAALRVPGVVQRLLGTREWLEKLYDEIQIQGLSSENIFCIPQSGMERIVGFNLHQGIMALCQRPGDVDLDELDERVVAFNQVENPENVGSIVRSAVAFEFHSLLVDARSADPFLRRAARVSMGNVFATRVHTSSDLVSSLRALKARGYRIIGTDARKPTARMDQFRFPEKYVLVIGSEVYGMLPEVLAECEDVLIIPTNELHPTLNASHAATVAFYAAMTQK